MLLLKKYTDKFLMLFLIFFYFTSRYQFDLLKIAAYFNNRHEKYFICLIDPVMIKRKCKLKQSIN